MCRTSSKNIGNNQQTVLPSKSVLLIDFQITSFNQYGGYSFYAGARNQASGFSLGLARIYAFLFQKGVNVKLIRYYDYHDKNDLLNIISDYDIVGVNAMSVAANDAFALSVTIKQQFPAKMIIGGAEHYALDYQWILTNKESTGCDICCISEGELPMLDLAKGFNQKEVKSIAYLKNNTVVKTPLYPRLNDNFHATPAINISKEWMNVAFSEFKPIFDYMGKTQIASGCIYSCSFCTNKVFYGNHIQHTLSVAKQEIENLRKNGVDFFFVCNPLLNTDSDSLMGFLNYMIEVNNENKMYWACFYSVRKEDVYQQFELMASAGCLMINVGIEDVVDDRNLLKKGEANDMATDFINSAKQHLLVRTLLMLGLKNHYFYSREEIKDKFLSYMKKNPQAIYRINYFTPTVGTSDFDLYVDCFDTNPRENTEIFKCFDTMHPLLNPQKMYDKLNVPIEKRWLSQASDWVDLQQEIMLEYLKSNEHTVFLNSLKDNDIQYKIATEFRNLILSKKLQ